MENYEKRKQQLLDLAEETENLRDLEILRCYFTTFCMDYDIECDTAKYDSLSQDIFSIIKSNAENSGIKYTKRFEDFDYWLGEYLC